MGGDTVEVSRYYCQENKYVAKLYIIAEQHIALYIFNYVLENSSTLKYILLQQLANKIFLSDTSIEA